MLRLQCLTEKDLLDLASKVAHLIVSPAMIFLSGPLGAGKTTFVRGFLKELGFNGKVKSPTYALVEPYEIKNQFLFHFDLYRLVSPNELIQIGLEDYLHQNAICLIEWPEKGEGLLPRPDLSVEIAFLEVGRVCTIKAYTSVGQSILFQIKA